MEEEKNENKKIKKNKIPNRNFKKSFTLYNRQKSINRLNEIKKYEKIFPQKRIIKSREKEIKKESNFFPLIKKNSNKSTSKKKNNQPQNKNIKNEINNNKNYVLPNFAPKKVINHVNSFKNMINNSNQNKINTNEDINKINEFIIKFFEEFIALLNSMPNKNLFISLLNTFYKKYILNYSWNQLLNKIVDDNFNNCLKYIFIIIPCLIFLSKDETSYKFNNQRLKELLEQFVYISLKNLKLKSSQKFKTLINRIKPTKKNLTQNINSIIKLLYNNKNEYITIKNAFNQIITNLSKYDNKGLSNIINNTILYNHNHQNLLSKTKKIPKINQNTPEELIPSEPYNFVWFLILMKL